MTNPSEPRRLGLRRQFVRLLLLAAGGYLIISLMFAALQRSLMYPAVKSGPLPVGNIAFAGVDAHDVHVTTDDGITLNGWHIRPAGDAGDDLPVILFAHGNGGNRLHRLDDIDLLTGLGAEVVIFDYRGYGENAGSPTEEGLASDARAMWTFVVQELEVPPERIVIFGESLGGGVSVRLAAEKCRAGTPPGGLILRSTFSSMTDTAAHHYPWLPIRIALLDRYDSVSQIGDVTCPILFLHGDADDIVPMPFGERLFAAAPRESSNGVEKRFVVLPGAGHNDVLSVARSAYRAAVATLLRDLQGHSG